MLIGFAIAVGTLMYFLNIPITKPQFKPKCIPTRIKEHAAEK
jgi:hypothetical protein